MTGDRQNRILLELHRAKVQVGAAFALATTGDFVLENEARSAVAALESVLGELSQERTSPRIVGFGKPRKEKKHVPRQA